MLRAHPLISRFSVLVMAKAAGPYQDRSQHRGRAAATRRWLNVSGGSVVVGGGRWRKRFPPPPFFAARPPSIVYRPPTIVREKGVGLKERDIFGSKGHDLCLTLASTVSSAAAPQGIL